MDNEEAVYFAMFAELGFTSAKYIFGYRLRCFKLVVIEELPGERDYSEKDYTLAIGSRRASERRNAMQCNAAEHNTVQ